MKYNTIREATEAWVREFSAIPQSLIEKAYMGDNIDAFNEYRNRKRIHIEL